MTERGRDEQWMSAAYANEANLTEKKVIEKQAKKVCCDQFLAALFIKMSDDGQYLVLC